MKRRLAYAAIILVWLVIMCFPMLAFVLAVSGEVRLGDLERGHLRVFMIQEDSNQGLGYQWARKTSDNPICYESTVKYLLWRRDETALDVRYCRCGDPGSSQTTFLAACD